MTTRAYSAIWCATYYLAIGVVSACGPFIFDPESPAIGLSAWLVALPTAYWMLGDAKRRGIFAPHIIHPLVAALWYLVVPVYLLSTRKWWGLLYLFLHVVCTLLVLIISYELSANFLWPVVFPGVGW